MKIGFRFQRVLAVVGLLFFLGGSIGSAQKNQTGESKHILWRVQSDSTVVYIMGSVHALTKEMYPLDGILERVFDSSEVLVLELLLDSAAQQGIQMKMMAQGMYPTGQTLKKNISKKTYELAKNKFKKEGLDIAMFNGFRPWVVAVMLLAIDMQKSGFEAEHGIDNHFSERARKEGKEVIGLETPEFQMEIFGQMSPKEQEAFLRQQILQSAESDKVLKQIATAWKTGDTRTLETMLTSSLKSDEKLFDRMVLSRNKAWVPEIEKYLMDRKRYAVVVGSLHLVGDGGVIELLRKKGYRVEQL